MTGTEVLSMPFNHPGAIREGSTVEYGPVHCITVHGGCDWCYANRYMSEPPVSNKCGCGKSLSNGRNNDCSL